MMMLVGFMMMIIVVTIIDIGITVAACAMSHYFTNTDCCWRCCII